MTLVVVVTSITIAVVVAITRDLVLLPLHVTVAVECCHNRQILSADRFNGHSQISLLTGPSPFDLLILITRSRHEASSLAYCSSYCFIRSLKAPCNSWKLLSLPLFLSNA